MFITAQNFKAVLNVVDVLTVDVLVLFNIETSGVLIVVVSSDMLFK